MAVFRSGELARSGSEYANFDSELRSFVDKGWEIVSDGPSGVQLKAPKAMTGMDKACCVFGFLTLIFWGIGLIFILIAVLDYAFFSKQETKFLPRT